MEKVFLMYQSKTKKKHTKRLGTLIKKTITQLVSYWTMSIFKVLQISCNRFKLTNRIRSELMLLASLKMIKQQHFLSLRNQKKQFLNFPKILRVSYKMETQKIKILLNDSRNEESKFATKKVVCHGQSNCKR